MDNREAKKEGWGCCPLLLQDLGVLSPGRLQVMMVDGMTERSEDLGRPGDEPGKGRRRRGW